MWECQYCHHEVVDNLDECSNCGTGKNWKPSPDVQSFNVEEPEASATSQDPLGTTAPMLLRILGVAVGVVGVIAGLMVLANAPPAPSAPVVPLYGDTMPTRIQSATRTLYLAIGWGQIIGGIGVGTLLYTVAGIADTVREMWAAQPGKAQ